MSIVLKELMVVQVSYLHCKLLINLDLSIFVEARNDNEIIKILKYLHLLLSSVTVNADAYNQTLT
jgi:predicted MPP superfamily phosphohydrolase